MADLPVHATSPTGRGGLASAMALSLLVTLTAACSNESEEADASLIQPMLAAVMYSRTNEVRRLAEAGIGLNERYYTNNTTPMIFAAGSDQWPVVEILLDHGADI
ncbi:hypothetical protein GTW25_01175 [Aliihoeflea aestuarii]|uniref:ankyrin repeat domain-containing protein n=1 Tax=Aliihoeflea aestuarii TaxID=453840 RepID=UPI0020921D01|nr:ankyrin repeat domain-containing protein [Aliihoeflea aestuarii]MCO6389643.1 hypothetical protein [Aliihoeflea aestuarii]